MLKYFVFIFVLILTSCQPVKYQQDKEIIYKKEPALMVYPVRVVFVNYDANQENIDIVKNKLEIASIYFHPINTAFEIRDIDYIECSYFINPLDFYHDARNNKDMVNLYIAPPAFTHLGLAFLPIGTSSPVIIIFNIYNDPDIYAHEIGHGIFNLLHIFDKDENIEDTTYNDIYNLMGYSRENYKYKFFTVGQYKYMEQNRFWWHHLILK